MEFIEWKKQYSVIENLVTDNWLKQAFSYEQQIAQSSSIHVQLRYKRHCTQVLQQLRYRAQQQGIKLQECRNISELCTWYRRLQEEEGIFQELNTLKERASRIGWELSFPEREIDILFVEEQRAIIEAQEKLYQTLMDFASNFNTRLHLVSFFVMV